jgi:hypothetical protein
VHLEAGNRLRVAAIEAFGQAEDAGEGPDRPAALASEVPVVLVAPFRCGLAMIPRDEADDFDLLGFEAAQVAVLNEVVRMLMVTLVADMDADVVEERRVLAIRARDR